MEIAILQRTNKDHYFHLHARALPAELRSTRMSRQKNGLVPSGNRTNDDPDLCHHMASLGHNELNLTSNLFHTASDTAVIILQVFYFSGQNTAVTIHWIVKYNMYSLLMK